MTVDRIITAGMMRRCAVADADATPQENRHAQTSAAHVLHLRNLVDQFTERIVDEVDEHEVDHRARTSHRRAATETNKPTLGNWRVAKPLRSVLCVQTCRGTKISTTDADSFAENKDF